MSTSVTKITKKTQKKTKRKESKPKLSEEDILLFPKYEKVERSEEEAIIPKLLDITNSKMLSFVKTEDKYLFMSELLYSMARQGSIAKNDNGTLIFDASQPENYNLNHLLSFNYVNLTTCNGFFTHGNILLNYKTVFKRINEKLLRFTGVNRGTSDQIHVNLTDSKQAFHLIPELAEDAKKNNIRGNILAILNRLSSLEPLFGDSRDKLIANMDQAYVKNKYIRPYTINIKAIADQPNVKVINGSIDDIIIKRIVNSKTIVNIIDYHSISMVEPLEILMDHIGYTNLNITTFPDGKLLAENWNTKVIGQTTNLVLPFRIFNIILIPSTNRSFDTISSYGHTIHEHSPSQDFINNYLKNIDEEYFDKITSNIKYRIFPLEYFSIRDKYKSKHIKLEDIQKEYEKDLTESSPAVTIMDTSNVPELIGMEKVKENIQTYNNYIKKEGEKAQGIAIVLTGIPGAGKTLASKWAAKYLGWPLLRFDTNALFNQRVGMTEQYTRIALNVLRKFDKCVILIDEVEKLLGGVESSNMTDGGITTRVMEMIMRFLEEQNGGKIIMMSSNNIKKGLPPELTRSGRVDGTYYVTFPNKEQLSALLVNELKVHVPKLKLTRTQVKQIVDYMFERTKYTGADIKTIAQRMQRHCIGNNKKPTIELLLQFVVETQTTYEKNPQELDEIDTNCKSIFEPADDSNSSSEYLKAKLDLLYKYIDQDITNNLSKSIISENDKSQSFEL